MVYIKYFQEDFDKNQKKSVLISGETDFFND